jgi:hypothetical protein
VCQQANEGWVKRVWVVSEELKIGVPECVLGSASFFVQNIHIFILEESYRVRKFGF